MKLKTPLQNSPGDTPQNARNAPTTTLAITR
jgi:hypothetical protein